MTTVTHTVTVNAPKTETWNVLKDFGGVHRWHFNIESSPISSDNNEGLGATRTCRFYDGTTVTEKIVKYRDGEFMDVAFVEFSMPLKHANVTFEVSELTAETSEVTICMEYAMKFGPVGWAMSKALVEPMMKKVFRQMLEGLDHHVVTGELIGKEGVVTARAA